MNVIASTGVCQRCGQPKLQVEGAIKCIMCEGPQQPSSGLVVTVADPGHDAMRRVLAEQNVFVPKADDSAKPLVSKPQVTSKAPSVQPERTIIAQNVTFESVIKQAIDLLQNLPMPKDIKQFKSVNRAVKTLESILEVK